MSLQVVDIIDCFLLLNVLKDTMEGLESLDKAAWIKKKMLHIFCDLFIKAIDMGMRPKSCQLSIFSGFLVSSQFPS
jgi:hypothetical protein